MKTYCYRLMFNGPVHFGETGIGMENTKLTLGSDGLTSAVINALAVLNAADHAVEGLRSNPPCFLLSNLFPFGPSPEGQTTSYALPRPLLPPPVEEPGMLRDLGKEIKRIAYLDPNSFVKWIGDAPFGPDELKQAIERCKALSSEWDPIKKFGWHANELRPRVALDRASCTSAIWHCGMVRFCKDAGLYGLVRVADEAWRERLESAFRLLGDMGLGGEKTYGMGSFHFSGFKPIESEMPELAKPASKKLILLSNYFPNAQESSKFGELMEAWDFFETRGYVVSARTATKIKRKRLRMVTCGSVARQPIRGALVDVTPDQSEALGLGHKVYRSGLALTVPEGGIG